MNERDVCHETVELCDKALKECKELNKALDEQSKKQTEITDAQKDQLSLQNQEIDKLKKEKTSGKILYGILGIVLGLIIHIPIPGLF